MVGGVILPPAGGGLMERYNEIIRLLREQEWGYISITGTRFDHKPRHWKAVDICRVNGNVSKKVIISFLKLMGKGDLEHLYYALKTSEETGDGC